jgi:hydroxymethylpyrimidine/phosphomethylpyrimidine kinase
MSSAHPPVVLSIAGHDPSGGAGIQADIEAITAQGCIATTVITCLTVQDTENIKRLVPLHPELVADQARTLLADIPVQAFKIGLLGNTAIADVVANLLADQPRIPVVLDPVLAAGGGAELAGRSLLEQIRTKLLPHTTVATPNSEEARRLTEEQSLEACAREILSYGCQGVLITGGHESERDVVNRLYRPGRNPVSRNWPRLPGSYHGSGCTLAASLAALLARGVPLEQAVAEAQAYTWNTLSHSYSPGRGQSIPCRFFKSENKGGSCKPPESPLP